MKIMEDVFCVGVNDHQIDLFEGQYIVKNGMSYNSYLIRDEKTAVLDTVDRRFGDEWLAHISTALEGERPDYLVIHHMEPDHSANIARFMEVYPETVIVSSAKAFQMMKQFFGTAYEERRMVVGEGDTLSLGTHTLSFLTAPMVHWPEVIMSYDSCGKILFSADAFGKFGALDVEEPWEDEARRYYIGIVGKYGAQVQTVLKKAKKLEIACICSLHGPVLKTDLAHALELYDIWSSYRPETEGTCIAYSSIYGHTEEAALLLAQKLREKGDEPVQVFDLARCDLAEAVAQAFRFSRLVLASCTYNNDVFPHMRAYIEHLTERGYKNRRVALMENGSWAPTAAKTMTKMLETAKDLTFAETTVKILSALDETSRGQIEALAEELLEK